MSKSGIHIKPSKKGTFTAAAKKHGKGVQEFARQVMANKENYSPAMVKKANFARNAAKWKHEEGGAVDSHYQELGGVHSMRPLPGHQVPVGKAFTPTPGHYYPMYERDMQPLPQKAMYGADIEPFVYHGYSENTPIGDGIKSNYKAPKEMVSAKSGIHINPENRGKFTATKKRTGKTTEELTHSKNPLTRKRAIFAQNARKWKHQDGGEVPQDMQVATLIGGAIGAKKEKMDEAAQTAAQVAKFMMEYGGYVPMAQAGTNLGPIPYHEMYMGRPVPSPNEIIAKERKNNQRIVKERKDKIKASEQARKRPLSAQQFADETQAIGDKLRLFPEDPNSFVDDFLNPGVFIGNLASGLGRVPLNLQQGNYGEAAMNVTAPFAAGVLSKIGTSNQLPKTTVVSNASQPYKNEILKSFMTSSPKPIRTAATNEIERQYADEALKSFIGNPDKQAVFEKWNPELLKYIGVDTNMGLNPHLEGGRSARNLSKKSGIFSNPADKFSEGYNLWDLLSESNYHMRKNKYGGYVPKAQVGIKLPEVEGISSQYVTPEMAAAATANYTAAQNQAANPIATAAGITTNSNMGMSTSGLTHEVGHSEVPSADKGILGMQTQKAKTAPTSTKKEKTPEEKDKKIDYKKMGMNAVTIGLGLANLGIKDSTRHQYYTPEDTPYYNPYPMGTGSQAIYEQGGFVNSNAVDFPYKSGIRFREGGEIMNVASLSNPIARMGGNIRRNMMSEYEQGGELELYDDRTGAQPISENPNAGPIVEFKGPSHEERNNIGSNGIPMAWNGNEVEVEGGETAFKDNQGNFQILGNMKNPLTGRKFKQDGKLIAKAERKADKTMQKGLDLINSSDPDNPYEMLRFNSGKAKMQGATQKFQEMEELRNNLAAIQQQKLDLAEALGIEPMEMDKKAYFGKMMTAQWGSRLGSNNMYDGYVPEPANPRGFLAPTMIPEEYMTQPSTSVKPVLDYINYDLKNISPQFFSGLAFDEKSKEYSDKQKAHNRLLNWNANAWRYALKAQEGDKFRERDLVNNEKDRKEYQQFYTNLITKNPNPELEYAMFSEPEKTKKNLSLLSGIDGKIGQQSLDLPYLYASELNDNMKKYYSQAVQAEKEYQSSPNKIALSSVPPVTKKAPATGKTRGAGERPNGTPPLPQGPEIPSKEIPIPKTRPEDGVTELPPVSVRPPQKEQPPVEGQKYNIGVPPRLDLTSDAEPFNWINAYPEMYAMATNQVEPVLMQKYRPELLQPYQVSFQDQLNRNTDTFRTMAKASGWNPSAMGALAAQKYGADQGVLANEFRTNQEISANIANANRQIMNETQQRNLGLADQQYVRQAQARANTRQRAFDSLQSLSTKKLQHQKAMNELKVMENLYNYRFDPRYRATYEGPNALFTDRYVYGVDEFGRPLGPVPTQKTQTTKSSTKEGKKYGGSLAREFKNYK